MRYECDQWRFLRILRLQHITQMHLAQRIGMSYTQLNSRIWGKVKWKHTEAVRACEALGITRAEFKDCYPYMWPLMGGD